MVNIILCGGSGTRLWPISRTLMPKQFVKLFEDKSLFQMTVERNSKVCENHFIVSNEEQYFLAQDQLEEITQYDSRYLLEPLGRNTAPAIALSCLALDKETIVLVTPSDHLIKNEEEYQKKILIAEKLAKQGVLVTFGVEPKFAETGFGYIEIDPKQNQNDSFKVKNFHEKPNIDTAEFYMIENRASFSEDSKVKYYWNAGIFCFKAGVFLEELKKFSPDIYESSLDAYNKSKKNVVTRVMYEDMVRIPEDSIDYAVMENSSSVMVVPGTFDWNDVGSFQALYDELPKDENNNTVNEKHISINSYNNLVLGKERQIATVGINDCVIVDTGDALLVSSKSASQEVKKIVQKLKESNSELHNIHLTGHRPWGTYTVLEDSKGYKIKRIVVKPGKRLSLQKHFHRNEHWIVVSGCATVTVEKRTFILNPNESTYIKAGKLHRLENQGKLPLVIIEAQVGEYTGEDDIVRIDDDYERK